MSTALTKPQKSKRGEPGSLPRLGVALDLYCDEFGVYRTTHRSAGGLYTTLMNLNHRGRDQPRNHACQGFLPNGCDFNVGTASVLQEIATLAKGVPMKAVDGQEYMVRLSHPPLPHIRSFTPDAADQNCR